MTITRKTQLYKMVKNLCIELGYDITTYRCSYKKSSTCYWEHELNKLKKEKVDKTQLQKIILNKYYIPWHLQFEIFKY